MSDPFPVSLLPGAFSLPRGLVFRPGPTCLQREEGGESVWPDVLETNRSPDSARNHAAWVWRYLDLGCSVRHELEPLPDGRGFLLTGIFRNESVHAQSPASILCHAGSLLEGARFLDRIYRHTRAMDGFSGLEIDPTRFESSGCCGFTDAQGTTAVVFGVLDYGAFLGDIAGERDAQNNGWRLTGGCRLEGCQVPAGGEVALPPFRLVVGDSLASELAGYADHVAMTMHARPRSAQPPTGWCSWYHYFGKETEADLLANLDALAASELGGSLWVFQIDDGWNLPTVGGGRVWGDWQPGAKFPGGMRRMSDRIRERGFVPGLWLAPFSVDGRSQLAQEHPDWMVQSRDEAMGVWRPAGINANAALHTLDLTQPAVLDFLRETFHRVAEEWGYDYVKIDFLQHALTPGRRQDRTQTPVQAFRQGLAAIRAAMGEGRFILGCGSPFGPAVGFCDGMRVGFDVGGGWDPPIVLPGWPNGNCCVRAAAIPAVWRHWMHGRWWINDPDCLVVRDKPVSYEIDMEAQIRQRHPPPIGPSARLCLDEEEAACWVRLVWTLGSAAMVSEVWESLSPSRRALLRKAFPPNAAPVQWVDWYEDPEIGLFRTCGELSLLLGVFNFSDQPKPLRIPKGRLQIEDRSWRFVEVWRGEEFSGDGPAVVIPTLAPRSGRLWRLVDETGERQVPYGDC